MHSTTGMRLPRSNIEAGLSRYRFRTIDAIRGVAAFIVVVWHYSSNLGVQPFYYIFFPFYTNGQTAVDLFFVISGFVLMHTYRDKIDSGAAVKDFVVKRLARLYPLHVITLLAMTIIFLGFKQEIGVYGYIYKSNDVFHFVLNLLMLQYVGLQSGWSFNGPSWTMSTEFWINILFSFMLLVPRRLMIVASAVLCMASAVFLVAVHGEWLSVSRVGGWLEPLFIRTIAGFFAGVVTYEFWRQRRGKPWHFVLGSLGVVTLMCFPRSSPYNVVFEAFIALIASPFLIYGAASFPFVETISSRRAGVWIGDVSFSVYMWHYPIACIFVLLGAKTWEPHLTFFAYLAVVCLISTISAYFIEFPVRKLIINRQMLLRFGK